MGEYETKKFMKKVCLTLMVTLLGVVSLMKADSINGATATEVYARNLVNIKVEDQYGNKINFGKVYVYDNSGALYGKIDLDTGYICGYTKWIPRLGEAFDIHYSDMQRYFTTGNVVGVTDSTGTIVREETWIDKGATNIKVWYTPTQTDYTLEANRVGVYVDSGWKNISIGKVEFGSKSVVVKDKTGLSWYSLTAGTYRIYTNGGGVALLDLNIKGNRDSHVAQGYH